MPAKEPEVFHKLGDDGRLFEVVRLEDYRSLQARVKKLEDRLYAHNDPYPDILDREEARHREG